MIRNRNWKSLGAVLLAVALLNSGKIFAQESARPQVSLDGEWNFATDPDGKGENEGWFKPGTSLPAIMPEGSKPKTPGKIEVPGPWERFGYGSPSKPMKHVYLGKGWYKKTVMVPAEWSGKKIFLYIGGAHRYAKTWVNGEYLGEHIGPISQFDYDITSHVKPGQEAVIAIQVDSKQRWDVDAVYGCVNLGIDYMWDYDFSGLWGHVRLEARPVNYLKDLYVHSKVFPQPEVTAEAGVTGPVGDKVRLELIDKDGKTVLTKESGFIQKDGKLVLNTTFPDAQLWSPDSPTLYTARFSVLKGNNVIDQLQTRVGIREIEIKGIYFYLNGKRLFLRGLGENEIYRDEVAMPTDKKVHLERYKLAKSYGFNFVRLHTAIMPEEYYEACDELGILVGGEFPIGYNKVYLLAKTQAALDTYEREWAATIKRYRNHPSIMYWAMGNELHPPQKQNEPVHIKQAPVFKKIAREFDPIRHFIDTDGGIRAEDAERDTLDFIVEGFKDNETEPIGNPDKYGAASDYTKPIVSHESGNYVTFPRFDQIERFTGAFNPWWLEESKNKLTKEGRFNPEEMVKWAENSEKLYLLLHKINTEAHRLNSFMSGYQLWVFHEHLNLSVGIVDHSYTPKGILTPKNFLPFNNDIVIVQKGLELTYRANSALKAQLLVSNYSENDISNATFSWKAMLGGNQIGGDEHKSLNIRQGELASTANINIPVSPVPVPKPLTVSAVLMVNGKRYSNEWQTMIYPGVIEAKPLSKPLYVDTEIVSTLSGFRAKALTKAEGANAIYVTAKPTKELLNAVNNGATLIVTSWTHLSLPLANTRFKTTWWRGVTDGKDNQNNFGVGTVMYPNPITQEMAVDGWGDASWYRLLEGAQGYILNDYPSKPQVLVRGIEGFEMARDKALLFQAKVGKGTVIFSGLNHVKAAGYPENNWILAQMVRHADSAPKIEASIPHDFLAKHILDTPRQDLEPKKRGKANNNKKKNKKKK